MTGRRGNDENRISFSLGEAIFTEGEPGNKMYLIQKGNVEVLKGDAVVARLGAGEPIGEMSLLLDEPRSATVRALNSVEALEITGENFGEILTKRPGIGRTIMKALAQRLKVTTKALSEAQAKLKEKS